MSKEILRAEILEKLLALNEHDLRSLSLSLTNQIVKFLKEFPELTGRIGAGYLPLKAEIAPVYQELLKDVPVIIAYPILKNGLMSFAIPEGLPKGGIWLGGPYHEVGPEWLLVPGLGFDLRGHRLGRGKGYYDRFLENQMVTKIGLCWTGQLVEGIPVEGHDAHMDYIITESFCWDVKQQRKF